MQSPEAVKSELQRPNNLRLLAKIVGAIGGGVLLLCLGSFVYKDIHQQEVLATAIDDFMRGFLPTLTPEPALFAAVPIGKNAVWWIDDSVESAGVIQRSTGTLRSIWGGGEGLIAPCFEELNAIIIVKGVLGEEKRYLDLPNDVTPCQDNNPFENPDVPKHYIDKYGRLHNADEFTKIQKTYGLQVWVVDAKSKQTEVYREFPAAPFQEQLDAFVYWIESLEKLGKKPVPSQNHYSQ